MTEIYTELPLCEETSDIFKYITTSELNDKTIVTASLRTFLRLFTVHPDFPALAAWYYIFSKEFPEIFPAPEKDEIVTDMMFLSDEELKTMINGAATDDEKKKTILMYHLHHTVLFTCDRGVSHELVRHRVCAFAQESTRYCNYAKNKFNNEITVIEPVFFTPNSPNYEQWKFCCETAEKTYMSMLENGATPQEARTVLPNSLKTEIVVTACEQEWQHIVNLRYHGTTGKPHPQMLEVMLHAYPQLVQASDFRIK